MITVLLPEFVPAKWWHQLLHNQSSLLLKGSLLFQKGVIVTACYHLEKIVCERFVNAKTRRDGGCEVFVRVDFGSLTNADSISLAGSSSEKA